jgi:hypothetical protein
MRYMSLWRPERESHGPPKPEMIAKMGQLIEEFMKSGVMIATDGLQTSDKGFIVRAKNGKTTITDGPFAETKELVAGYAIFNVKSKEQMVELTKRFLKEVGDDGICEVRQMYEGEHVPEHPTH